MKKIAFFVAAAALLASCTKWENKSTEFKVTGVWTGINQQVNIQALPFLDSTSTQSTTMMEANFMDNGGLTIDSAGTRMDSLGWAIKNDTILTIENIDLVLNSRRAAVAPLQILILSSRLWNKMPSPSEWIQSLTVTVPGVPIPLKLKSHKSNVGANNPDRTYTEKPASSGLFLCQFAPERAVEIFNFLGV
jgi:hypothetical protein